MKRISAADLPTYSWHQLATAYGVLNARAVAAARTSIACARAMAARDRVAAEVYRRGLLIRRSALDDGSYIVGRPADFVPIERPA